ncbi:MFS transporter [Peribacillus deserti]|nr:MFS transporter [Peribacillus deserti]
MRVNTEIFYNKNFLFYWLSAVITSLGDSIFVIALTWLLVEKTGSPAVVGTYLFILGISKLVFIIIGGAAVDRFDPKKLLLWSTLIRAAVILLSLSAVYSDFGGVWIFYLMSAIFGSVDAIAEPAAITARTRIVTKEFYTQSMGLLMTAGNVSAIIGPMLGAGLVAAGSTETAIIINALIFMAAAFLLSRVNITSEREPEQTGRMWQNIKDGFSYFLHTPIILTMAIFAFFSNAAVGAILLSIPFLSEELGFGVSGYGMMNTAIAIGGAAGSVLFSLAAINNPKPWMTLLTCFIQGIFILLTGVTGNLFMITALIALIGLQEAAVNVIAPSVNHAMIPSRMFGRVISVMILVMSGSVPLSQAAAGWLMETVEPQTIFIYEGLLEMVAAFCTFLLPFVRKFEKL